MYTFNRLQLLLVDEDKNPETFIKTAVGDTVKFFCQSFGGRPLGEFKWYIDNNQQMLTNDNHFNIGPPSSMGSDYDYEENYQSTIEFKIDSSLLDRLKQFYHINISPSTEQFSFNINCEVRQSFGDLRVGQKIYSGTMEINVKL